MNSVLIVGLALGMRHGTDPDHLAAIDGLTRVRPRPTNGVLFALGHGLVVLLLAVGIGHVLAQRFAFVGPWVLIVIGVVNVWRLRQKTTSSPIVRPVVVQPFLLGMLLAAGFETASQLSALIVAGQTNPWLLGLTFATGMVLVDGLDGYFAASTQRLAATGDCRSRAASQFLGIIVVIFSFGLGGAELLGVELDRFALPLGLCLFVGVLAIRVWARSKCPTVSTPVAISEITAVNET